MNREEFLNMMRENGTYEDYLKLSKDDKEELLDIAMSDNISQSVAKYYGLGKSARESIPAKVKTLRIIGYSLSGISLCSFIWTIFNNNHSFIDMLPAFILAGVLCYLTFNIEKDIMKEQVKIDEIKMSIQNGIIDFKGNLKRELKKARRQEGKKRPY